MIANPTETAAGSLIVQPHGDDNESEVFDVKANMTLSTALKLPMVKLTVSGKLRNSSVADGPEKAIQRAIVFVIDRSGSMSSEDRIGKIRDVLQAFIEKMCEDETVVIKVVLFDNTSHVYDIPRDRNEAKRLIQTHFKANGGDNLHEASKGLVTAATKILNENPTFQLTVIMCSDGETSKELAVQGHKHWAQFVNDQYLKIHKTMPYVETIGIGSTHDADVLTGFILDDEFGNYVRCEHAGGIANAYNNANNRALERNTGDVDRVKLNFPINVYDGVLRVKDNSAKSTEHDIIVKDGAFSQEYWVPMEDVNENEKNELSLTLNGEKVAIEVNEIKNHDKDPRLDYCESTLTDVLQNLRDITDGKQLQEKATALQEVITDQVDEQFVDVSEQFSNEKAKLMRTTKAFVEAAKNGADTTDDLKEKDLLNQEDFDRMRSIWKEYRQQVRGFSWKLQNIKKLVSDIVSGKMENKSVLQQMRQRILDLHFSIHTGTKLAKENADDSVYEDDLMDMMLALVDNAVSLRSDVRTSSILYRNAQTEYKDDNYSDFTFLIGKEKTTFPIIKAEFAMHSSYFAGILYSEEKEFEYDIKEDEKEEILMDKKGSSSSNKYIENDLKVTVVGFSVVKQYFYRLNVEINMTNLSEIWYAASKYGITELLNQCEVMLDKAQSRSDIDFILFVESSAVQLGLHPDHSMRVRFQKWLTPDRCVRMIHSQQFVSVCKELIVWMMNSESFTVPEEVMWTRCGAWCQKRDPITWAKSMRTHFTQHIEFAKIQPDFFREHVFTSGVLRFEEAFEVMVWLTNPHSPGYTQFRESGGRGYGIGGGLYKSGGIVQRSLFSVYDESIHLLKKEKAALCLQYTLSQSSSPEQMTNSYEEITNNNLNEGVATLTGTGEWVMAVFDSKRHILRIDIAGCFANDWTERDLNMRQIQYKNDEDEWVDWRMINGLKKERIHVMNMDIHSSAIRIISIFNQPVVIGCLRFYGHDDEWKDDLEMPSEGVTCAKSHLLVPMSFSALKEIKESYQCNSDSKAYIFHGYNCSGCTQEIKSSGSFHCQKCRYDLCVDCYQAQHYGQPTETTSASGEIE